MLTTNIDKLIGNILNAGFEVSVPDMYAAGDFLSSDPAATEVTLPARLNGEPVGLNICIVPHEGFYSRLEPFWNKLR